jgi:hypothetical protein
MAAAKEYHPQRVSASLIPREFADRGALGRAKRQTAPPGLAAVTRSGRAEVIERPSPFVNLLIESESTNVA